MRVGILAAETGHGHISVANALKQAFEKQAIEADVYPSFYEDLMVSNRIISDYYNFLMSTSPQLCYKFSELSYRTRPDLSEEFYLGVEGKLKEFILTHKYDVLVSTSHTINHAIIRALKELELYDKVNFYIVITDPYIPISVGFDIKGAKRYFCSSKKVKEYIAKNVEESKISVTAFPIKEMFLKEYSKEEIRAIYKKLRLRVRKKILLINSGSQGSFHSKEFLKEAMAYSDDLQIIFICGKNEALYELVKFIVGKKNERVRVLQYVDNMNDLLKISDFVVTKAGANSFFECFYMHKPMLIDSLEGFLYQEKGVCQLLQEKEVGTVVDSIEKFREVLGKMMIQDSYLEFLKQYDDVNPENGADAIVKEILEECKV